VPMKQIAFIVVSKEWFNTGGINHILANGRQSQGSGEAHLIMADNADLSDHRGIWLTNVITTAVLNRSDESPVKMKFMIPWHYVLGLGLPDVQSAESTIGFKAGAGITLVDAKGEVE
jgi:hypothetical protein